MVFRIPIQLLEGFFIQADMKGSGQFIFRLLSGTPPAASVGDRMKATASHVHS
ncbi:hypothetical protein GLW04_01220 [Halobacillus litoralis]|uniref:Uncharacterized protein n=1 Tax=Halobacillus litoralis TaxID=45668 RepID=A0A845DML4_9BACI|nr:hypothetical protein [Halobacillus litoralis]